MSSVSSSAIFASQIYGFCSCADYLNHWPESFLSQMKIVCFKLQLIRTTRKNIFMYVV